MLYRYKASDAVVASGVSSIPNSGTAGSGAGANDLAFAVAKPTYVAADSRLNNKPTVYHNLNSLLQTGTLTTALTQPSTVYAMSYCVDNGDAGLVYIRFTTGGSFSNGANLIYDPSTDTVYWGEGGPINKVTTALYGKHVTCVVNDGTSTALYIDDMTTAIAGASGTGGTLSATTFRIGGFTGVTPDMAWTEQITYSGSHSSTQRANVKSYMTAIYGT
jgi:hypothetical protein